MVAVRAADDHHRSLVDGLGSTRRSPASGLVDGLGRNHSGRDRQHAVVVAGPEAAGAEDEPDRENAEVVDGRVDMKQEKKLLLGWTDTPVVRSDEIPVIHREPPAVLHPPDHPNSHTQANRQPAARPEEIGHRMDGEVGVFVQEKVKIPSVQQQQQHKQRAWEVLSEERLPQKQ